MFYSYNGVDLGSLKAKDLDTKLLDDMFEGLVILRGGDPLLHMKINTHIDTQTDKHYMFHEPPRDGYESG